MKIKKSTVALLFLCLIIGYFIGLIDGYFVKGKRYANEQNVSLYSSNLKILSKRIIDSNSTKELKNSLERHLKMKEGFLKNNLKTDSYFENLEKDIKESLNLSKKAKNHLNFVFSKHKNK